MTKRDEKKPAKDQPELSAREALLSDVDKIEDPEKLKQMARRLRKIGKAKGPNDPILNSKISPRTSS